MAVINNPAGQGANSLTGKVILKENGLGIPDLLVVIYDFDSVERPDEALNPSMSKVPITVPETHLVPGDRICSIITDQNGCWSINYEDIEFRVSNPGEKRPDLQLMILGPEDADSAKPPVILFNSKMLRVNSGRTESYIVRLTSKQLIKAQIPLPTAEQGNDSVESKIQAFRDKKTSRRILREGIKEINKEFDDLDSPVLTGLKNDFRKVILPDENILNSMYNFVKKNDKIKDIQTLVFKTGSDNIDSQINNIDVNNPVPGKGIKINVILTDDEKQNLSAFKFTFEGHDYYNIPENKIQEILFKRETDNGTASILFSDNPISKYCMQKSASEKCAVDHLNEEPSPGDTADDTTTDTGTNGTAAGVTNDDIPFYLEKILINRNNGDFGNNKDYQSHRSDDKSVQANVDNFSLQKGPADTTAFYDFHSLQIAFQYVWQQLLDETLVNLSEKIHTQQENSGKQGFLTSVKNSVLNLSNKGINAVLTAIEDAKFNTVEEVPTEIAAAFDISFIEYDALSNDNKTKLLSLARDINKYETTITNSTSTVSGIFGLPVQVINSGPDNAALALVLRDQGERIIDNIRINKPYTTNQMLKELQEKLLSKYEFTVFAADQDYHSINFGLLNTYRQKWEPISYQAGKLVKTIPLSPKEERKYSVKTTETVKFTKKQAQKNNTSLQQEVNTTTRAESEIIAKAQDKSNFNLSVKLDYSRITSELTFGKQAEKDSSQTKKDFREAVIKAAQEFKEERSLEIDAEETSVTESTESGTIVNPNDELSVTYLFYELQRRYRVSEQLYRVMPVVMVAQQVPAPDQITEGWIVAHDWILNRVLLDDSFRPTLGYLAQKNVGDDFAIRELRKNLRQQRTLVNQLQIEFSKLKQDVENKYSAMESAVRERINEEHIKRTYKWWWWFDSAHPDTPPDPEMAKALEQAATDEHKYAVEKAEKMALSVQREVNALHQLTLDYNAVMQEHLDNLTQTRRLITHVKENILYYMQAIWSMEPPDQRYMRLYKASIPYFEAERTCIIQDEPVSDIFAQFRAEGKHKHVGWLHGKIKRDGSGNPLVVPKQLVEAADLDTLIGFKGNYMIFPLKEHNALTELMAAPYVDEAFGAMDPDEMSNLNLGEFSNYICCLHDKDPDEFERLKPVLTELLKQLLADPLRNGDEIIIPTGSLFIEMLPSEKSLLEDFKLKHREWDVYKVQAEVRKMELENIRYAARILNLKLEDPEIDKKIILEGDGAGIDITDN